MAMRPSTAIQNENEYVPRGKGIGGVKADQLKPEKKNRKDRKALKDLAKPAKHLGSTAVRASTLKQKSSLHDTKTTKRAQASPYCLTDEEIKKCHEWAEEEIDKVYYTGNDILQRERDAIDKCVNEEVNMVLSCIGEWNKILYDNDYPLRSCIGEEVKKIDAEIGDMKKLEFELEILLPASPISGLKLSIPEEPEWRPSFEHRLDEGEWSFPEEPESPWPSSEHSFEFKLKDDYEGDAPRDPDTFSTYVCSS